MQSDGLTLARVTEPWCLWILMSEPRRSREKNFPFHCKSAAASPLSAAEGRKYGAADDGKLIYVIDK